MLICAVGQRSQKIFLRAKYKPFLVLECRNKPWYRFPDTRVSQETRVLVHTLERALVLTLWALNLPLESLSLPWSVIHFAGGLRRSYARWARNCNYANLSTAEHSLYNKNSITIWVHSPYDTAVLGIFIQTIFCASQIVFK